MIQKEYDEYFEKDILDNINFINSMNYSLKEYNDYKKTIDENIFIYESEKMKISSIYIIYYNEKFNKNDYYLIGRYYFETNTLKYNDKKYFQIEDSYYTF